MRFLLAALLALSGAASAQTFPAPGTSVFTWERVGDVPLNAQGMTWTPTGQLLATGPGNPAGQISFLSGDGPNGTWSSSPMPRVANAVVMLSDGIVLAGQVVIDRSPDGLPPWTRVCGFDVNNGECSGPERSNAFLELPPGHAHAGRVLAGSHNYSDDRGLTWTAAPFDRFPNDPPRIAQFALLPSGRVLAAADGWGFLSSDDGGASWQTTTVYAPYRYAGYGIVALATPGSVQSGAPDCGLSDPSLCEGALAIGTDATDAFNRTWLTNDGGRSWRQTEPLEQDYDGCCWGVVGGVFDLGLDAATGLGRAVAVLGRGFVFATRDGGQTWDVVARAPVLPPDQGGRWVPSAVLGPDGRLYASVVLNSPQRDWVWRTREPVMQAFAVAGEAGPSEASGLSVAVWPNPARGRAEVALTLAEASAVRVVVVDMLGRETAVVLDGAVTAGERVVPVDVSAWPAGVYVVRVTAGARVATARLVVAR